jgi:hypothetical protein
MGFVAGSDASGESSSDSEDSEDEQEGGAGGQANGATQKIVDYTEQDLVNLRCIVVSFLLSQLDMAHTLMVFSFPSIGVPSVLYTAWNMTCTPARRCTWCRLAGLGETFRCVGGLTAGERCICASCPVSTSRSASTSFSSLTSR